MSRAPRHNSDENHWCRFFFLFFFSSRLSSSHPVSPSPLPHPFFHRWRDRSALGKRFRDEKFQYDLNSAADTPADIPETERVRANSTTDWKALFAIKRKPSQRITINRDPINQSFPELSLSSLLVAFNSTMDREIFRNDSQIIMHTGWLMLDLMDMNEVFFNFLKKIPLHRSRLSKKFRCVYQNADFSSGE